MPAIDSPLAVVRAVRWPIAGLKILDIGCGTGLLAKQLSELGADVAGVDPEPEALRAASNAAPQAAFEIGVAEALPFEDGTFDLALLVNALHHVPEVAMQAALMEAGRALKADGTLIVIEPLASGNFFAALRLVEDETDVRHAAQLAIEAVVASGQLSRTGTLSYVRRETFRSAADFLKRIVAVDPSRQDVIDREGEAITKAVVDAAQRDAEGGLVFDQPIKADLLTPN
jgi:SAM-dependent methyltransferase